MTNTIATVTRLTHTARLNIRRAQGGDTSAPERTQAALVALEELVVLTGSTAARNALAALRADLEN